MKLVYLLEYLVGLLGLFHGHTVKCHENEYFSSVSGLEDLMKTEELLLKELQDYVDAVTNHVVSLQSEIDAIKTEHDAASKDSEGYLNNPINAYRLMKRLHSDWYTFEDSIRSSDSSRQNFLATIESYREILKFPTQQDVIGSAAALVRLQETYKLDVAQVASGVLNGVKYGSSMTWQDCFMLGHHLYEMRDFNHTVPWLKQSMKMLNAQEYKNHPLSLNFMEDVVTYHQEMGDFETALNIVNHILSIDNKRYNLHNTKSYLQDMLTQGIKQGLLHDSYDTTTHYHKTNEFKLYEKVCRGEKSLSIRQQRDLHCKYYSNNVPYRLLQPFKMEEHSLDPYIVQFYDVISEKQIDTIKRLSKRRMSRSKVHTNDGADLMVSTYRTSKSAWFKYETHDDMQKLLMHVQDFSGLNVKYAEELQVANYGIGGHYEPHWDFLTGELSYDYIEEGNRAATSIYYLSDVEEGGSTVFPFLHVSVKPKKGSVLFWYNLHKSEDPDYRTKHAACPVLKGSKWIANIWIRTRNQDRERPCGLKRDHESSLGYKDFD